VVARKAKELSALEVGRLKASGMHAIGGVAGLYLQVVDSGARTWILRATVGERRRDMGLGGFPDVTLAMAREKARQARQQIDQGIDPIEARRAAKSKLRASAASARTFRDCALAFIDAKSSEWGNQKHAQQWVNTLEQYAFPIIGDVLIRDVELAHVLRIVEPIWRTKTETASRLRGRIESVLDWATVRGYRDGDNPSRWRGHLDKVLPAPSRVAPVKHHDAMAIDGVPAFFPALRAKAGNGARALEFLALTATRSEEVRGASWHEIDFDKCEWLIPAHRRKGPKGQKKELRVPLSLEAARLLQSLPRIEGTELIFPSPRVKVMSDMTLTKVLRDMKQACVPHGFRSTFRDWASERTDYPAEVAEMALGHVIGNKVEAAYRRGELFDKRRQLMSDWAAYCG
jgi:integrase